MDSSSIMIMLVITLIMPGDKSNISYREGMHSIEECLRESRIFLNSNPPESIEAEAIGAQCVKRVVKASPASEWRQ